MPRTTKTTEQHTTDTNDIGQHADAMANIQNTISTLTTVVTDDHALVNQLLGQAQMADAISQFSRTVRLTKLAYVKENKLYKAISGQKTLNGSALKGTWEEFCELLGYSKDKVDLDLQNLRTFGEEALESMSRMGIGYREMRQFRKLPDDQRAALIEVAKDGDKESLVELAEELISKHTKEKETLQKERDETRADYDAQSELIARKNAELDATRQELEKTRRRIRQQTPDEAQQQLKIEVAGVLAEFDSLLKTKLHAAMVALTDHGAQTGTDQRSYMHSLVRHVETELAQLKEQIGLDDADLLEQEPDWMHPDALAKAEALIAAEQAQIEQEQ